MPKRKRKGRGRPSSSLDNPAHQNPNPSMIHEEDNDVQPIENPQILKTQQKDENFIKVVEEEEDKGESFNVEEVEPEGLSNVTPGRAKKKKKKKKKKKDTTADVAVDVKDSLEDPDDVIHDKSEDLEAESEEHEEEEEEEGMTMNDSYSPIQLPPVEGGVVFNCVFDVNDNNPTASNVSKQVLKKKPKSLKRKKSMNAKKKAALDKKAEVCKKKLELLEKNLHLVPFVPERKLDFSKHEELLKRLGLWDFVHIEFSMDLRSDLIALFVANYDPSMRASDMNGRRIKVSRADLARALNLPVKKEKGTVLETTECGSEGFSKDAISFVEEFASSWVLLHEDAWMVPKEVVNMTALIKSGQLHKVDWPSLLWFMVERELKAAPEEGTLYYASHMQCLMKSQREGLFKEEVGEEDSMDEGEAGIDVKIGSSEPGQEIEKEEQFELCLGPSKDENEDPQRDTDAMEYQDYTQELGGQAEGRMDDKSRMNDFSLSRCNFTDALNLESLDGMKEEAEEDNSCDLQSEEANEEGLVSADLLQGIGATNMPCSQSFRFPGHSSGNMYHSDIDINLNTDGTSMFPNSCKRENSHDEFVDDHIMTGHHKRMRNDGSSSEFSVVVEQINFWTEKAKIMYEEKAQASFDACMNENQFLALQQQNNVLLNDLQKAQWESARKDRVVYRLEHELHLMTSLLEGYKKALKEDRRAFSEYKEHNPKYEEPLYKDVGPGGLVLSTIEIERQRLEIERQRSIAQHMVETSGAGWFKKLEACANDVSLMNQRLLLIEDNIKLLKDKYSNLKTEDNSMGEV